MTTATIAYARNHLSALLRRVREGEEVLILDRTTPVARLAPVAPGGARGDERIEHLASRGLAALPEHRLTRAAAARLRPVRTAVPADLVGAVLVDREEGP